MDRTKNNLSDRNKPRKKMTKAQMQLAIIKKRDCDAEAQVIVEKLLEPGIDSQWLLENVNDYPDKNIICINYTEKSLAENEEFFPIVASHLPGNERRNFVKLLSRNDFSCHMEDVVEERSIEKLCGYVLCKEPLTKVITQRYHISTKRNKLYDVSQRKNFCSSFCYGATNYLLEQMLTSPLWLRKNEKNPKFRLMPDSHKIDIPGEEVVVIHEDLIDKYEAETNKSEAELISKEKDNMNGNYPIKETKMNEDMKKLPDKYEIDSVTRAEENILIIDNTENEKKIDPEIIESRTLKKELVDFPLMYDEKKSVASHQRDNSYSLETTGTQILRKESKIQRDRKSSKKFSEVSKNTLETLSSLVKRIEKAINEWITEDTLHLLFGEETIKQQVFENITKQEKYAALCQKLNKLQLDSKKEERVSVDKVKFEAVPDYSILQEEGKKLELKVRAFYEGRAVIDVPNESHENKRSEKDEDMHSVFPLTDSRAPKSIRRKIFLEKIQNVLPDLLRVLLGNDQALVAQFLYSKEGITAIESLVSTFALTADNIVFKSAEWILVGHFIIKLLSLMNPSLKYLLSTEKASMRTTMILMSYQLDSNYLDTFVNSLNNQISCYVKEPTSLE